MEYLFSALSFLAGAGLPLQIAFNVNIAKNTNPIFSAIVSFSSGLIFLIIIFLLSRSTISYQGISSIAWWAWFGGLFGAFYIALGSIAAPVIGATSFAAFVISAQMIASAIIDHYGLLGFEQHSLSLARVIGIIMLIAGMILLKK